MKKNKKEYSRSIMEENKFIPCHIEVNNKGIVLYKASNNFNTMSKRELAQYINNNYGEDTNKSREDILKDLVIFKNLKKSLELELRIYESFIKSILFLMAILSFAVSSSLNLLTINDKKFLAIAILVVSIIYLIFGGVFAVKSVSRKKGPGKLDVIEYGINVLEIKLDELDGNQDK